MFVCAYSKILNVQRFSSFYAIYLILSLEMSDKPLFCMCVGESTPKYGNIVVLYINNVRVLLPIGMEFWCAIPIYTCPLKKDMSKCPFVPF